MNELTKIIKEREKKFMNIDFGGEAGDVRWGKLSEHNRQTSIALIEGAIEMVEEKIAMVKLFTIVEIVSLRQLKKEFEKTLKDLKHEN